MSVCLNVVCTLEGFVLFFSLCDFFRERGKREVLMRHGLRVSFLLDIEKSRCVLLYVSSF